MQNKKMYTIIYRVYREWSQNKKPSIWQQFFETKCLVKTKSQRLEEIGQTSSW